MGLWKEIKYALNSSLGKSSFVPLDELIKSNRHLVVSDNVLFSPKLLKTEIYRNEEDARFNICNFRVLLSGQIDLFFGGETGSYVSGYHSSATVEIEKNGQSIFSQYYEDADGGFGETITTDVDVNDEFSIYFTINGDLAAGNPFVVDPPKVYAEISDNPIKNI